MSTTGITQKGGLDPAGGPETPEQPKPKAPPAGADRVLRKIVRLKRRLELPPGVGDGPQRFTTKKPPNELT
jgi:hypothetical protein